MFRSVGAFVLCLIVAPAVMAADYKVSQKGRKFSEKKLDIAVGDTITFVNDDDITHNVHSRSKGHEFDMGAKKPGEDAAFKAKAPGSVKIRCAIHPKMKLKVTVK